MCSLNLPCDAQEISDCDISFAIIVHQHELYDSNQRPTTVMSMHRGGALLSQSGTSGRVDLRQCLPYCLQPSQEPGMLCRPQHVSTLLCAHPTIMIPIVLLYNASTASHNSCSSRTPHNKTHGVCLSRVCIVITCLERCVKMPSLVTESSLPSLDQGYSMSAKRLCRVSKQCVYRCIGLMRQLVAYCL